MMLQSLGNPNETTDPYRLLHTTLLQAAMTLSNKKK